MIAGPEVAVWAGLGIVVWAGLGGGVCTGPEVEVCAKHCKKLLLSRNAAPSNRRFLLLSQPRGMLALVLGKKMCDSRMAVS
eukprot:3829936-Rhodomonas_salina.1